MELSWVFYAVLLFVSGSVCFFTALSTLDRLDKSPAPPPAPPPLSALSSEESPPKLTRLGRPVQQIQIF